MADRSILGVFAHPDDEQLMSGLLAKSGADGVRTGLVCATKGEEGEIADDSLATAENLGNVREDELRAAAAILGVRYLWFLDYCDSGMAGTPQNDDLLSFHNADEHEAVGKIVQIVRDFKPAVMVTFDPSGGYGHPDHIKISRLATAAFAAAADPAAFPGHGAPWQVARLFYAGFPRSWAHKFAQLADLAAEDSSAAGIDWTTMGLPDEDVTNEIDVRKWAHVRELSRNAHKTQADPNGMFAKLPADVAEMIGSTEFFALAAGVPVPRTPEARADLFAGLE